MKRALLFSLALATLCAPLAVSADDRSRDHRADQRHDRREEWRDDRRDWREDRRDHRRDDRRDGKHAAYRWQQRPRIGASHYRPSHYRPSPYRYVAPAPYYAPRWRTGQYLPAPYRGHSYRIDYRRYRLAAPPRGYYYARVDRDTVLVAAATGLIANVILHALHD